MNNKKEFYLMVTAFAPNKRVDLAIAAFNQLKLPLKIIGSGQEEKKLRSLAGPTIEFLGNLDRIAVIDHLCRAQGFIFPGVEDFGITPLESLASGTPVIAFKAGGVLETLNEDVAFFFNQATVESLKQAVKDFQSKHFNVKNLYARAEEFSKEKFIANIQKVLFF
jgi:glycosyltransferase involved in cell wall biosynthesis